MEQVQIKHFKNLIMKNLSRNLPRKVDNPEVKNVISTIIKRTEYYMKNYTNNFYPDKYNISIEKIPNGKLLINICLQSGDIIRRLIFLDNGEMFGVKHYNRNKPYTFTYGLSDKSVELINFKTMELSIKRK